MAEKTSFDLIILGAGPAGMTAGVYAARKQLDTLIISRDLGGQTSWSSGVENYLGFISIAGIDLVHKFEEHLKNFNVPIEYAGVTGLSHSSGVFRVETDNGKSFTARSVIIATGKSPRLLSVPGEREFTGRGVTYCTTCDGPLFAGQEVAVVGGGNSGLESVIQLMKISPKVYLIEKEPQLKGDEIVQNKVRAAANVEILSGTSVLEVKGDQLVDSLIVAPTEGGESTKLDVKGVFIEIGLVPNTEFVRDLLWLNKWGEVPVDCAARTMVSGLFAAGDVTDVPEKQIICAAGDGAKAALGAYAYIVRLPVAEDWAK